MKAISVEKITSTIDGLGIAKGDNIFIHSSLFTLGNIAGHRVEELPNLLLQCFQTAIGAEGSLFMPAFNYDFPKQRNANLISQKTVLGFWPEWFRQQPNVERSGHPMFSICGLGQDAFEICKSDTPEFHAFGPNSTFDRLVKKNATLVLQGIGLRVATVVVHIESMLQLKYRFNKPFHGDLTLINGENISGDFHHFCFPMNNAYRESYSRLEKALLNSKVMTKLTLGRSFIYAIKMKSLFEFIEKLVQQNPFALLNCTPTALYRYENGQEIAYPL
ncbi:hypothetical protein PSECIP111854_01172 [Pseudoalteromonas sp. CIP111854]|uniref:Aminoglycoside N(3)-acetyltransferase n=1 Tax=Pseudoalteromonas holothuriae TaxID=2963714 RepID=A0A9W4QU77_9GAMM|nr:AAC(3) family N-acetyltransferase [Pseudoalteromonas sp. CIP111854]CAH9053445.1 hypothetical protein PSECIP111854_01172 [Pseudoalteromonas sp. CIP111854]